MSQFARHQHAALTYAAVGATRDPTHLPARTEHLVINRQIGRGDEFFARAAEFIETFVMQRSMFTVVATTDRVEVGTVLVMKLRLGPLRFTAPARVVYLVADDRFRGFAYGTLPGHPESGEERFSVRQHADGSVWVEIVAFSTPGRWFTRLGAPGARLVQARATRRYLDAVSRC